MTYRFRASRFSERELNTHLLVAFAPPMRRYIKLKLKPSIKITTFNTDIKKKEELPTKLSCRTGTLKIHQVVTTVVGNTVKMSASDLSARLSPQAYKSLSGYRLK